MLESLLVHQPLLRLHGVDERFYVLRGSLNLYDQAGAVQAAFPIEMTIPRNFPSSPPVIREVGGLIPQIADRHINSKDATCCIQLPVEFHKNRPKTLKEYVEGPLTSYFLAQLHYDRFQKWPNGERAHGGQGLVEYCQEELGTDDLRLVGKMIGFIGEWRVHPKGEKCPCGSHQKISKCHEALFDALQKWSFEVRKCFLESVQVIFKESLR